MTAQGKAPPAATGADAAGLDARLGRVYDHLYANASFRTPAAIAAEVGKLLRTAAFAERGAGGPAFRFEASRRRALARGEPAAVRALAREVRAGYRAMRRAWRLYPGEALRLSDRDLAFCCAELDGVAFSAGGRDVFGDAVEIFRTSWAKRHSGQFFTDGRVARLAMALLEFDPRRGDDLVDVCCGTGGFLLAGLDRLRDLVARSGPEEGREADVARLGLRALRGQEVDPEIRSAARASLAGRLGARGAGLVLGGDSLDPRAFRAGPLREGRHRCAASNPPFGAKITVKDPGVLRHYDLARAPNGRVGPRPPDVLLLERNLRMLAPGEGRLAIVVPYQILSGPQTRPVREWLLRQARLEAVVDLPAETFQPHTGTKTSLLLLRRRPRPLAAVDPGESGSVFMSTPRWIGHDRRGRPVFRRDPDGRSTGEVLSDIEAVAQAFEAWRQGAIRRRSTRRASRWTRGRWREIRTCGSTPATTGAAPAASIPSPHRPAGARSASATPSSGSSCRAGSSVPTSIPGPARCRSSAGRTSAGSSPRRRSGSRRATRISTTSACARGGCS